MKHTTSNHKGFTLIELLVVIAIIAILAAILFPVFAQAKAAAKKTSDLSNQKNIATANVLYSGDVDDVFVGNGEGIARQFNNADWQTMTPYTGQGDFPGHPIGAGAGLAAPGTALGFMDPLAAPNWGREMFPYIKSMDVLVSPGSRPDTNPKFAPGTALAAGQSGPMGKTSYAMNGCVSGKSQTAMALPAEVIIFQSRATTTREAINLPRMSYFRDGWTGTNDTDLAWTGHNFGKGGNYAYADGHAKFKMRNAVRWRDFGFWEWVNINGTWTPPSAKPTMRADPTKPAPNDFWGDFGACDPSQTPQD